MLSSNGSVMGTIFVSVAVALLRGIFLDVMFSCLTYALVDNDNHILTRMNENKVIL